MKTLQIKFLLPLSILSFIKCEFVKSVCVVRYPSDIETSPIYAKMLGEYTLQLPFTGKDFQLNEGEIIQAFCRTKFSSISYSTQRQNRDYYRNSHPVHQFLLFETSITLMCHDSKLHCENSILEETILQCNKPNWSVYDTNETYEWCEINKNAKTLLLAAKSNEDHHILAGICFNLSDWSLQTITYNVTNSGQKYNKELQRDITKSQLKSFQSLGEDLSNLKNNNFALTEYELRAQLEELSESNLWFNLANYETSPIVQGDSYENYFNEFVNILNIIWWRNLRLGNWKIFMNTLENYANQNRFQIYTGISGVVKIPIKNTADVLEIKNGYVNKTVPDYIWTYLTSTDNQNDDFIIVGYNSPFAEWFGINNVIFCPDICSEIPWLKEISSSFRYATAGIMFCCSADFVRQTNYLHGFPMAVLIARSPQNQTSVMETENTADSFLVPTTTRETTELDL